MRAACTSLRPQRLTSGSWESPPETERAPLKKATRPTAGGPSRRPRRALEGPGAVPCPPQGPPRPPLRRVGLPAAFCPVRLVPSHHAPFVLRARWGRPLGAAPPHLTSATFLQPRGAERRGGGSRPTFTTHNPLSFCPRGTPHGLLSPLSTFSSRTGMSFTGWGCSDQQETVSFLPNLGSVCNPCKRRKHRTLRAVTLGRGRRKPPPTSSIWEARPGVLFGSPRPSSALVNSVLFFKQEEPEEENYVYFIYKLINCVLFFIFCP